MLICLNQGNLRKTMKTDINKLFDINVVEIDDSPHSFPMEFMDDFIRIVESVIEAKNQLLSVSQYADASLIFKVHRNSQNCFNCEVYFAYKNDKEYNNRYWRGYVLQSSESYF